MTNNVPFIYRFGLSATAGCIASSFCHPLDVIRIQMQTTGKITYKTPLDAAIQIGKKDITSLWSGLSAAYLRQFTYSGFRLAVFSYLLEIAKHQNDNKQVSLSTKLMVGATAGIAGSIIGNPAELALVRMADDSKLPIANRRNYKSSLHACVRVVQEEGTFGLWRGVVNSSLRAAVVNSFQLGIYGPAKSKLVELQPNIFITTSSISTMFVGANISAFFAISASMPLDVVKSRLMSQAATTGVQLEYAGMVDCFQKIFQTEGIVAFYRGFLPAFVKLAPYTVISFTSLELLTKTFLNKDAF